MRYLQLKDTSLLWEFDFQKNSKKELRISSKSSKKINWICPKGHKWATSPLLRSQGLNCIYCEKEKKVKSPLNESDISKFWSLKNNVPPSKISTNSIKKYIWECDQGHMWLNSPINQTLHCTRCKYKIIDAKTFIKQKYPKSPISILEPKTTFFQKQFFFMKTKYITNGILSNQY